MFYINHYLDQAILKPDVKADQVKSASREAIHYQFAALCLNPCYLELAAPILSGSDVALCSVIDFPLGASLTEVRVLEAKRAVELKATEIDAVMNISAAKNGNFEAVYADISSIVEAIEGRALLKVVIETAILTDEEKIKVCKAIKRAKADFIKTSTGTMGGASEYDIALIKRVVEDRVKIKASGGINTKERAIAFLKAGANRIGTSHGVDIVTAT
ncbi:MAG: deoxyribose-phosphate aldolase [Clostridia bacterium]